MPSRKGTVARKIDALAPVVDAWLAADPRLKASVVHERLEELVAWLVADLGEQTVTLRPAPVRTGSA